jgi:hypothetical protein
MPGLDPGIHLLQQKPFTKRMDCRVKPGNDSGWISADGHCYKNAAHG